MKMELITPCLDENYYNISSIILTDEERKISQKNRLLRALQQRAITTLEARDFLFIMSPAPRVQELREEGHNIVTFRVGKKKIARYVLFAEVTS